MDWTRFVAFVLIAMLTPILVSLYLLNGSLNGWPSLFYSTRVGKGNQTFIMPKLRTLRLSSKIINTSDNENLKANYNNLGLWFRKYSLDELFQLFSVLKGDMLFIGYRPSMTDEIKLNRLRTKYRITDDPPGITGLAQVLYRNFYPSTRRKVACEKYYQANKNNLRLNVWIILMTIYRLISPKNIK